MRRALAAALGLVLAATLAACGDDASQGGDRALVATQVPGKPLQLADTALRDTEGEPLSLATDLDARLTLVFFGYTNCPDICPAVMASLTSALTRLDDDQRAQVDGVFVTTDPSRDTGAVLRRYLDRYDPTFTGLTGELEQIVEVARSAGVFVADAEELASGGYDLGSHGAQVLAVQSDGTVPMYWHQDTSSAQFAADIAAVLEEQ